MKQVKSPVVTGWQAGEEVKYKGRAHTQMHTTHTSVMSSSHARPRRSRLHNEIRRKKRREGKKKKAQVLLVGELLDQKKKEKKRKSGSNKTPEKERVAKRIEPAMVNKDKTAKLRAVTSGFAPLHRRERNTFHLHGDPMSLLSFFLSFFFHNSFFFPFMKTFQGSRAG